MPNVAQLITEHVTLTVDCVDRLYLNAYVPRFQTEGGVVAFLRARGYAIPSPALFVQLTADFKTRLRAWAPREHLPWIDFQKRERKDEVVQRYRDRCLGQHGIVCVGVTQEMARAWTATKTTRGRYVHFAYRWKTVCVNHYYRSVVDRDWGPAFLKVCGYAPYAMQLCLNGHEWANWRLRPQVAEPLGSSDAAYTARQMGYDLRSLARKGLIARVNGKLCYTLTAHGRRVALFLTKLWCWAASISARFGTTESCRRSSGTWGHWWHSAWASRMPKHSRKSFDLPSTNATSGRCPTGPGSFLPWSTGRRSAHSHFGPCRTRRPMTRPEHEGCGQPPERGTDARSPRWRRRSRGVSPPHRTGPTTHNRCAAGASHQRHAASMCGQGRDGSREWVPEGAAHE